MFRRTPHEAQLVNDLPLLFRVLYKIHPSGWCFFKMFYSCDGKAEF